MLNENNRQALTEILEYARALGDDEIAADAAAALRGDREAFAAILLDLDTRADYSAWRPL